MWAFAMVLQLSSVLDDVWGFRRPRTSVILPCWCGGCSFILSSWEICRAHRSSSTDGGQAPVRRRSLQRRHNRVNVNCMFLACELLAQVQRGCGRDVSRRARLRFRCLRKIATCAKACVERRQSSKSILHSGRPFWKVQQIQEASSDGAVASV